MEELFILRGKRLGEAVDYLLNDTIIREETEIMNYLSNLSLKE